MRKNKVIDQKNEFSILTLDDDKIMTETLQSYFQAAGYRVDIENDPLTAIERIKTKEYDILLLDFLMRPILGDEVVRQIRTFDQDLFIILLTGHKSMAPPIKTIRELDIQGYYEKSDRFDQLELLIESCAKSIRQMRTIRNYRDGLSKILEQVPRLNHQQELSAFLSKILEQVSEILPCKDGFVYLDFARLVDDKQLQEMDPQPYLGMGKYSSRNQIDIGYFNSYFQDQQQMIEEKEKRLLTAPLSAEGRRQFGILQMEFPDRIRHEDVQLLEVYAKQLGEIVNNLILHSLLQLQNKELSDAYASMRQNYFETIDAIRKIVDAKDFYTRGHSDRVAFYAVKIAQEMGKSSDDIERIRVAGLFHDIGKIGIPDEILRKNGPLTDEEYALIKEHPSLGEQMLSSVSLFNDILPVIAAHHERMDGRGYPAGLTGEQIPEEARTISVADYFDAMTSKRTYRSSLTREAAIAELKNGKNGQFDSQIVDVFLRILDDHADTLEQELAQVTAESIYFKKREGEAI